MDPFSSIAAGISSSFRLLEVTYQLKAVGEQVTDLLFTTRHVDTNLNEARRLRRVKETLINHGERAWIDAVIGDTDSALRAVAKLIEPARVNELTQNSINLGNKVLWVFRDNPQVKDKHARLSICHQSLTAVISCLCSENGAAIGPTPEENKQEQPPPYDPQMKQLLDWHDQRRRRKSHMTVRDGGVWRPMSTGSAPTDTQMTSPITDVVVSTICVDESVTRSPTSLIPLSTSLCTPPTSPGEYATERPLLRSSVSIEPLAVDLMKPFSEFEIRSDVGLPPAHKHLAKTNTPLGTNLIALEHRQRDEEASDLPLPYPMSPSDYSTVIFSECTEQASKTCKCNKELEVTAHPAQSNKLSRNATTEMPFATAWASPNPDDRNSRVSKSSVLCNDGADGLQVQEGKYPEQHHDENRLHSRSLISASTSSPYDSSLISLQQEPHSAGAWTGFQPPRLATDQAYNSAMPIAELATCPITPDDEESKTVVKEKAWLEEYPRRPASTAQGSRRRGGRSWLMFHASRGDSGQSMG